MTDDRQMDRQIAESPLPLCGCTH